MHLTDSRDSLLRVTSPAPSDHNMAISNPVSESLPVSKPRVKKNRHKRSLPREPARHVELSTSGSQLGSGACLSFTNTKALCSDLQKLPDIPEICDIKFLVGKSKRPVYGVKAILATRNRTFFEMILSKQRCVFHDNERCNQQRNGVTLLSKIKERLMGSTASRHLVIDIPQFDPDSFRKVIVYLQTGCVKVDIDDVIGVLTAADVYGLPELRDACFHFAKKSITMKTVVPLLRSAEAYRSFKWTKMVVKEAINFISRKGEAVLERKDMTSLSEETLVLILSCQNLQLTDEKKWDVAYRWTKKNCGMRDTKKFRGLMRKFASQFHFATEENTMSRDNPLPVTDDVIDSVQQNSSCGRTTIVSRAPARTIQEQTSSTKEVTAFVQSRKSICVDEHMCIVSPTRSPLLSSPSSVVSFAVNSETSLLL